MAVLHRRHPARSAAVLQGYAEIRPGIVDGLRLLDTFVRLRWMCTALYLADRIARGITRGERRTPTRSAWQKHDPHLVHPGLP